MSAFWWGAYNGISSYATQHRGILHFYNNTVVNHHNGTDLFFLPSTTYSGSSPTYESVDCRNNIYFSDTLEHLAPQGFQARVQQGNAMDLGALESSGLPPAPPAGGVLQFATTAYAVAESGGSAVITVTRTGGSVGVVSASYATLDNTAAAGGRFRAPWRGEEVVCRRRGGRCCKRTRQWID